MLTIDLDIARRFILGKQGVWPGRRFQGVDGTADAMRAMEYLQLDPLQMITRSQDIALHSRVADYTPALWEEVTYRQRQFFDWGGWLACRPMEELPHWRVAMRRERETNAKLRQTAEDHADTIVEMRAVLADRGTVTNRDFTMTTRTRTDHYRGRKDSALALYYLWRTGEVMTHHRENFERVYALTETVAPANLIYESDDDVADRFLILKEIGFHGLGRVVRTGDSYSRGLPFAGSKDILDTMLADGEIIEVKVDGWRQTHCMLRDDIAFINDLAAGRVPAAWQPLDATTTDEVTFLAPLDPVSARGRAKLLFGTDYIWEVYKPAAKRQYGYYVLPVLWGDQFVARFDSMFDRTTNTFVILGFWPEDDALGRDEAFSEALARGFHRFVTFLGAEGLDATAIQQPLLRKRVAAR